MPPGGKADGAPNVQTTTVAARSQTTLPVLSAIWIWGRQFPVGRLQRELPEFLAEAVNDTGSPTRYSARSLSRVMSMSAGEQTPSSLARFCGDESADMIGRADRLVPVEFVWRTTDGPEVGLVAPLDSQPASAKTITASNIPVRDRSLGTMSDPRALTVESPAGEFRKGHAPTRWAGACWFD
jgi:hypothetical protein